MSSPLHITLFQHAGCFLMNMFHLAFVLLAAQCTKLTEHSVCGSDRARSHHSIPVTVRSFLFYFTVDDKSVYRMTTTHPKPVTQL